MDPRFWQPPDWIYNTFALQIDECLPWYTFVNRLRALKRNKSCSRFDMVVSEMLQPFLGEQAENLYDTRNYFLSALREVMFFDMIGAKTRCERARRRLVDTDVPLSFLPPSKRRRVSRDLLDITEEPSRALPI